MVSLNNPKNNSVNKSINIITNTGLESEDDLLRGNLIFNYILNLIII